MRRRYSSFLSLHQALQGLYPVLIIPPIPSKQSITDYAVKGQSKTKEDVATIATRKRLLEDFLRRVCRHPILGGEHVFHRFLEDGVSWVSSLGRCNLTNSPRCCTRLLFRFCRRIRSMRPRITPPSRTLTATMTRTARRAHHTSRIISYRIRLQLILCIARTSVSRSRRRLPTSSISTSPITWKRSTEELRRGGLSTQAT